MSDILLLMTGAILVNHFMVTRAASVGTPGVPYTELRVAAATAVATTCATTLSSICIHVLYRYVLVPFDLVFLRTVAIMLVIVGFASASLPVLAKVHPRWLALRQVPPALLISNGVILSAASISSAGADSLIDALLQGFGISAAVSTVVMLFAALREKLNMGDIPEIFQGPAIMLVTVGLASLALMGFTGLV